MNSDCPTNLTVACIEINIGKSQKSKKWKTECQYKIHILGMFLVKIVHGNYMAGKEDIKYE